MSPIDIIVSSKINKSFRVKQLESIFDIPLTDKIEHRWKFDANIDEMSWNIGLFVGPSGSGKTQILKKLYPDNFHIEWKWTDAAVIDDMARNKKIQEIISTISSVGFSSPPSWLKSYNVLSNGEKFRCELARCILEYEDLFVFDEFSSVVNRDVAKVTSYAVSKALRNYNRKMIAASCHYDIIDWLEPDWVYDLRDNSFLRRRLRRPKIRLNIREISREAWKMFKPYHYLSGRLHIASKCYGAFWKKHLIAFCSVLPKVGYKGCNRIHRLVTLPDYQGIGVGLSLLNEIAKYYQDKLQRKMFITSSHPAVLRGLQCKSMWTLRNYYSKGTRKHTKQDCGLEGRANSCLATYEYIGTSPNE